MTKKELIERLAPYPDDIILVTVGPPHSLEAPTVTKINILKHSNFKNSGFYFKVDKSQSDIEAIWL